MVSALSNSTGSPLIVMGLGRNAVGDGCVVDGFGDSDGYVGEICDVGQYRGAGRGWVYRDGSITVVGQSFSEE